MVPMAFRLNNKNVFDYICQESFCTPQEQVTVEQVGAKNFNLLLTLHTSGRKLFVKQERSTKHGTAGELQREWQFHEFLRQFSELSCIYSWVPEVLHFDVDNSIVIHNYLDSYRDLLDFYTKENSFPTEIATHLGTILAGVHRATLNRDDYKDFLSGNDSTTTYHISDFTHSLDRVEPEIFGSVPNDGIKFFILYQRYKTLSQAVAQLSESSVSCCVTHNDLKLNNVLVDKDWHHSKAPVRLLDWERSGWGDPASDLGAMICSYLQFWLNSLVISRNLTLEESLSLATTPLEQIQPSIAAMTTAYIGSFPEICQYRTDFLLRSIQFAGLGLIQQIQAMIQYQKTFGNGGIAMLQVAKSLLCYPAKLAPTVFGAAAEQLNTSFQSQVV
jgi:hypothetical protein